MPFSRLTGYQKTDKYGFSMPVTTVTKSSVKNKFYTLLWGRENTVPKVDLLSCYLTQVLKRKEGPSGMGWSEGNTSQGKTAACAKAQQCERSSNLGNYKQHNTSRGWGKKNIGRSEMFIIRKLRTL